MHWGTGALDRNLGLAFVKHLLYASSVLGPLLIGHETVVYCGHSTDEVTEARRDDSSHLRSELVDSGSRDDH